MTHTVPTPRAADAGALRARRRRRALAAALLASGAGALGLVRVIGEAASVERGSRGPRLYLSVQSDEQIERAACEHVACPTSGTAMPRRESVQRTRSLTVEWSSPTRPLVAEPTAR